jgi:hypothetical protein
MYQYHHVHGDTTNKRTLWANKAYSYFIEEKNEILIGQNRPKIEEFPIQESIISELVEYWTQYYATNTIRILITLLHKSHIERGYEKFDSKIFKKLQAAYTISEKQRVIMCRLNKQWLEGIGKAPSFYVVPLHILNLVPENYRRYKFYMSLYLFMMHTGQRFITMSNVKLSDIRSVHQYKDRIIVKVIARITKANTDWNQEFNLEGYVNEKNIMDAVYWLNEFLKEEHDLNIINFNNWDRCQHAEKYLWGNKSSKFSEKISYETIYKTWRIFYTKAGIPDKLMGVHSFRSGFYCQSILNTQLKGITEDNMKVFSQLLAGWKTEKNSSIYYKKEMMQQSASYGFVEDPTPELLMGYDGIIKSSWDADN